MSNLANVDMNEYWNGEGGQKWIRFQDRTDVNLIPFGIKAMDAAALSIGEKVIDIGCGCGDTSFEMARRIGPGGHVKGVDISMPILERAKARSKISEKSEERENIIFVNADAQTHNFNLAEFDVVFSRFGVMFFDDPIDAFSNIRKALKPDGRLSFICWQEAINNEWISLPLSVVAKYLPLPEPPGSEEPGPLSFGDINRVHHILSSAGYSDVAVKGFYTPFNIGGDLDEAVSFLMQLGPAAGVISQPDVDDSIRHCIADELRKKLNSYITDSGIFLGAATWAVTARNL